MIKINKKGFTLVEVLASAIILAIITTSVVFALSFSQNMVQGNSNQDAYAAEAQAAADVIMNYVNGGLTTAGEIENQTEIQFGTGAKYLDAGAGFNSNEDKIQFQLVPESGGSGLYEITVRLYYGFINDRESVEMICFAHPDW